MDFLPWSTFTRLVERYGGDHRARTLTCAEQYRAMAFAQLTFRESLRDIETCLSAETGKTLVFLTNQRMLSASTVCDLYKSRWYVELFFKWIKQHLRIKRFYGTSENAVKTQIWIAVSVYVLVAIVKKRLNLEASLLHFAPDTFADPLRENAHSTRSFAGSPSNRDRR